MPSDASPPLSHRPAGGTSHHPYACPQASPAALPPSTRSSPDLNEIAGTPRWRARNDPTGRSGPRRAAGRARTRGRIPGPWRVRSSCSVTAPSPSREVARGGRWAAANPYSSCRRWWRADTADASRSTPSRAAFSSAVTNRNTTERGRARRLGERARVSQHLATPAALSPRRCRSHRRAHRAARRPGDPNARCRSPSRPRGSCPAAGRPRSSRRRARSSRRTPSRTSAVERRGTELARAGLCLQLLEVEPGASAGGRRSLALDPALRRSVLLERMLAHHVEHRRRSPLAGVDQPSPPRRFVDDEPPAAPRRAASSSL